MHTLNTDVSELPCTLGQQFRKMGSLRAAGSVPFVRECAEDVLKRIQGTFCSA